MALLDALRRKRGFTDTEGALADFILKHTDEVTGLSIGALSASAHTSNAAVVRLCRKLGLDGYRDFRIALAREIERARSHVFDVNPDKPFIEGADTNDILSSIAALSRQAIDASYEMVNAADIRKAARLIQGARHIAWYAIGDTAITVEGFSNLLLKLGIICNNGVRHDDANIVTQTLDARDLAIVVTYSGTLVDFYPSTIKTLRERGCKMVLITSDQTLKNRLAGTDCVVLLPEGEARSGQVATFFSQECIRYVLNSIYSEVFALNWQESVSRIDRYWSADQTTEQNDA